MKKKTVKKKAVKKKVVKKKAVKKKLVKKKAVKKLETSDSLNPAIGKMKQEVFKKKQKFVIDYFGEG